ncbi:CLUMA_CG020633, isoform A [Clunio marinus]|uniref:CLUMA_CG020633, isoform A n=1 Tax=Clunio marinus TaxID=568069 RepID=A0A1J1J7B9_9DIPT|nr:CLUMA_CG020633, isoform A [Clunio marinus]
MCLHDERKLKNQHFEMFKQLQPRSTASERISTVLNFSQELRFTRALQTFIKIICKAAYHEMFSSLSSSALYSKQINKIWCEGMMKENINLNLQIFSIKVMFEASHLRFVVCDIFRMKFDKNLIHAKYSFPIYTARREVLSRISNITQ